MSQVPSARVPPNTRAFMNLGLDYFVPFYVIVEEVWQSEPFI